MGGSDPPSAPKTPKITDPEVAEARLRERELARRRKGRQSTILTSGMGAAGSPTVARPMLG